MTTVTIIDDTPISRVTYYGSMAAGWTAVRDAASALVTSQVISVQCIAPTPGVERDIYRGNLIFDTTSIKPSVKIKDSKIKLYLVNKTNTAGGPISVRVLDGQPTYPHNPVVDGDYDRTLYSGDGGSRDFDSDAPGAYYDINLNATGIGWINKGGITKFRIANLEKDVNDVDVGALNYKSLGFGYTAGQYAKLEVTFSGRQPVFKRPYIEPALTRVPFG